MSGFETEPDPHRAGACDINTLVDHDEHLKRKSSITSAGQLPFFPSTQRNNLYAIRAGQIVVRRKGSYMGEKNLFGTTTLCGVGAEEMAEFPNDPELVKAAILAKYDVIGTAVTEYNPETDAPDQGFMTAIAGLAPFPLMTNQRFEPGQIIRAALADDDPSFALNAKLSPSGMSLASYPWRAVPEDYQTPGNLLMTHFGSILEDEDRWKAVMSSTGALTVDKWLASARAEYDSAITSGLLFTYVLLKMGYLVPNTPTKADPYSDRGEIAHPPPSPFTATTKASDFVITMAELLGVQTPSVQAKVSIADQTYFTALKRRILMTIFYSGKFRPLEFGQREESGVFVHTRDPKTGAVQIGSREGMFLHNQLNHVRKRVGGDLQALDEHASKRLGLVVSGPGRRKKIVASLSKSFF